jgi:hypothetical protein
MSASTARPLPASLDLRHAVELIDARVIDATGHRCGRVAAVLADRDGRPWWFVLRRRRHDMLAPVAAAMAGQHREVVLGCTREQMERAPQPPDTAELTSEGHDALIEHFGLPRTAEGRFTRR